MSCRTFPKNNETNAGCRSRGSFNSGTDFGHVASIMEKEKTLVSSFDDGGSTSVQHQTTGTEPYPGPGFIESATQLVKNWVRQGYNDLIAGWACFVLSIICSKE